MVKDLQDVVFFFKWRLSHTVGNSIKQSGLKIASVPRYAPEEVPHFAAFIPRGCDDAISLPVHEDDTQ